jgi:poly(A) polymerase
LPEDVFKEGEQRPVRTKKPKAAVKAENGTKKRNAGEANLDVRIQPRCRQKKNMLVGTS